MSVFVDEKDQDNIPQTRCRKKYETKYSIKYENEYVWVGPSAKGETYAQCRWCQVDICIKSVGAKGLRDHEITGRHKQKSSDQQPMPPAPTQLNNAVYPVLEVEGGGVEQSSGELLSLTRPTTPQTPNTPLSPEGEDLPPSAPPSILDLGSELPPPPENDQRQMSTSTGLTSLAKNADTKNSGSSSMKSEADAKLTSTDDLTCNVCGQEYSQWTQLKKHLLEHIFIAQNSSEGKTKACIRGRGRPPSSKSSFRPSQTSAVVTQNNAKQESNLEENVVIKRRGRPPGSRNKIRGTVTNPLPSHQMPRRTTRIRTNARYDDTHETAVDDPEFICSDLAADGASLLVNDGENIDKEDKGASKEDQGKQGGCEDEVEGTGKRKLGPLQCRVCRVIFYNRGELREHQRSEHNNGRPYQCNRCQKFFTTKNHMEVHVRHKHSSGPNPCQCAVCFKILSSRTNLRIHMRIHKGERPFECPMCHKAFSRKANMEMHILYHTGERRFTCEVCGQSFFAINALKRHTKLHTGERNYVCGICGATYVTGTDLRRHRLKHDDVKPFPCQLCEKQFTRFHDLKVHLRYHNKELRYTCEVCNRQFVESGNYRRHLRRHTGERPYTCNVCLLTFSQVHHLKTHVRTNHGDEPSGGEEVTQNSGSTRGRLHPHRNPRLPSRRTPKLPQMHQAPGVPSHSHPLSHQHLPPHPHSNIGPSGSGSIAQHATQTMMSPPMAHSGTAPSAVVPMHSTQIPTSGSANHSAAMTAGFRQYSSHLYNHSVMPHYPTLFDMCPQQNCVSHLPAH